MEVSLYPFYSIQKYNHFSNLFIYLSLCLLSIYPRTAAVDASIQLYKSALKLQPENPSYCLSVVHTLEICYSFQEGFLILKEFCKLNKSLAVGPLSCQQVLDAIQNIEDITNNDNVRSILSANQNQNNSSNNNNSNSNTTTTAATPTKGNTTEYSGAELDLLALFFTLAKISYVAGSLEMIPLLSSLLGRDTPLSILLSSSNYLRYSLYSIYRTNARE